MFKFYLHFSLILSNTILLCLCSSSFIYEIYSCIFVCFSYLIRFFSIACLILSSYSFRNLSRLADRNYCFYYLNYSFFSSSSSCYSYSFFHSISYCFFYNSSYFFTSYFKKICSCLSRFY